MLPREQYWTESYRSAARIMTLAPASHAPPCLNRRECLRNASTNTDADDELAAQAEQDAKRDAQVAEMVQRASVLEAEAVSMRDELDAKGDALRALEAVIAQAASKESARRGGGSEHISRQVVAAKVAEAESLRRMKRAQEEASKAKVRLLVIKIWGCPALCLHLLSVF